MNDERRQELIEEIRRDEAHEATDDEGGED
jgi:hypothetical protein